MAEENEKLNKYIDVIIDIVIDSYITEKRIKESKKYDKVDMSSTTDSIFDGRLGQSDTVRLSSPGRPLKLYGKQKSNSISEI